MKNINEISEIRHDTMNKLKKNFEDFTFELIEGTKNINNFISINKIEEKLGEVSQKNNENYLEYISKFLNSYDEKKLIEIQKKNSQIRE